MLLGQPPHTVDTSVLLASESRTQEVVEDSVRDSSATSVSSEVVARPAPTEAAAAGPSGIDTAAAAPANTAAEAAASEGSTVDEPQDSAPSDGDAELPPGWEKAATPEGYVYYINHIDKTTTYTKPVLPGEEAVEALPTPWQELATADDKAYYYNPETELTQWERPVAPM